jgi:predicted transcriptional regulator
MKVAEMKDELKKRRLKRIAKKARASKSFHRLAIEHGEYDKEKEEDVEERDMFETRVRVDNRSAHVFNIQGRGYVYEHIKR